MIGRSGMGLSNVPNDGPNVILLTMEAKRSAAGNEYVIGTRKGIDCRSPREGRQEAKDEGPVGPKGGGARTRALAFFVSVL